MADDEKAAGPQTISVGQAAALLERSERHIQILVKEGFIKKGSERGKYTLVDVVRGAMAYYEERLSRSNKAATANKASEARTKQIEQQMAIRERMLVPRSDFYLAQDFVLQAHRAELAGFPARITRDLELRKKIEAEIDGTFARSAERIERAAHALAEGGAVLDALGTSATGRVGGEE